MSLGELRRILGPATGFAVCVGMAVGAGILTTPGSVAKNLPSGAWVMAVWCVGALVATLDVFILAEMSAMVPRVGGLVAYVRLSYGPRIAFLVGWSMLLITWPASLAFVAVSTGELIHGGATTLIAEKSTGTGRAIAVAVIAGVGGLNLVGLRFGARFEIVLVFLKLLLLAGICVAALFAPHTAPAAGPLPPFPATTGALFTAIGLAMSAVLFTYDGYADAVYMGGETRDPGRSMPRALLTALAAITGLYLLANATFLHVLGVNDLAHSRFPALDVATRSFGETGGRVLTVIALPVLFSAVNAYFLTGPRIGRFLAEEGLAMRAFGRVGDSGAPVFGTVWLIVVASAFALTNWFNKLYEITVPIIAATTMLVAIGLLVQRARAPDRPRPFRLRGAPVVVALQVALGLALLASFVKASFEPEKDGGLIFAIDAGALLLGLCCYSFLRKPPPGAQP